MQEPFVCRSEACFESQIPRSFGKRGEERRDLAKAGPLEEKEINASGLSKAKIRICPIQLAPPVSLFSSSPQ